eukprot:1974181-Rhodomonas_salina.1
MLVVLTWANGSMIRVSSALNCFSDIGQVSVDRSHSSLRPGAPSSRRCFKVVFTPPCAILASLDSR